MTLPAAHAHRRQGSPGAIGTGSSAHTGLVRCACQGCGSHVHAIVLRQTISGLCPTCGGCDIARLKR